MKKILVKILFSMILAATFFIIFTSIQIYSYDEQAVIGDAQFDAAIVLGAAVWSENLSPVFRERVNHALNLYKSGKVRKIIFTGGQGNPDEMTEAAAARKYALANGIPETDILVEEQSHTTYENFLYAKPIAETNQLKKILVVSDPLHMKRSMLMARDIGLDAHPSPTPTTMYQSASTKFDLLVYETYYYLGYLVHRTFLAA